MEPGPARAKANWLRLFSRVRLQLQEVLACVFVSQTCTSGVHTGVRFFLQLVAILGKCLSRWFNSASEAS